MLTMSNMIGDLPKQVKSLYLSHGGGPLPLLGDPGHQYMVESLQALAGEIPKPNAIIVVSAHWEAPVVTITGHAAPPIIYDYYGFPSEAYEIEYPAPGHPELAEHLHDLFMQNNIQAKLDERRGFDHGLYVPLNLMYPDADIPCIQVSMLSSLDPQNHIEMGEILGKVNHDNVLIVGSGFSFHNLPALIQPGIEDTDDKNLQFEQWLNETCSSQSMTEAQRQQKLLDWEHSPSARYCHPREEHLLPLHVCYGAAYKPCAAYQQVPISGKMSSIYLW